MEIQAKMHSEITLTRRFLHAVQGTLAISLLGRGTSLGIVAKYDSAYRQTWVAVIRRDSQQSPEHQEDSPSQGGTNPIDTKESSWPTIQ